MKKEKKKYWEMNAEELAAATKQFDEEFVFEKARPLTAEEQKQWERIKRKRPKSRNGHAVQRITVSLERSLLRRAGVLAKKKHVTRSQLIAEAIEAALTKEE